MQAAQLAWAAGARLRPPCALRRTAHLYALRVAAHEGDKLLQIMDTGRGTAHFMHAQLPMGTPTIPCQYPPLPWPGFARAIRDVCNDLYWRATLRRPVVHTCTFCRPNSGLLMPGQASACPCLEGYEVVAVSVCLPHHHIHLAPCHAIPAQQRSQLLCSQELTGRE